MAESKLRNLSVELFVKSDLLNRETAKETYNECGPIRKTRISSVNTSGQVKDKPTNI